MEMHSRLKQYAAAMGVALCAAAMLAALPVAAVEKPTKPIEQGAEIVDLGNGIVQEATSGRMWQKERSRSFRSLEEAQEYAAKLRLGGYTDWRLPTVYELYDLHYLFDLKKAEGLEMKLEGNYWSGEQDGEGMVGSWEIGDQCEPERQYFKKSWGYVRVVRP